MNSNLTASLLDFLDKSPTPYHAVNNMATRLDDEGFEQLPERDSWSLQAEKRYYVIRGGSSLVAFVTALQDPEEVGIRMVGAHTDSPCLKVKPQPEIVNNKYLQLGVEVYGGALFNPWFDRDLSMAGRVTYLDAANEIYSTLLDYREPIAVIPSLAIHLDREVNKNKTVNPQQHLPAILSTHDSDAKPDFRDMLLSKLKQEQPEAKAQTILDFDLCLYDSQLPQVVGLNHEFIASARLDNLVSCHIGLCALLDSRNTLPAMLVCNDHEEVGSQSAIGAQGPFLRSVLERWCGSTENYQRAVNRSMLISADNSHGIHPNYVDKHDQNHGPLLNDGPVIKINHNQRYATNSITSAIFRQLCEQHDIPLQVFVSRTDLACGSTIGPLTSSEVGVQTLDLGIPQFAMHSIRELCGVQDVDYLYRSLLGFYASEILL
ncbi:MAG: M18 family aminopeptidase [Arenicellales bacterium]|nr:M18 family aminopeptidase [Arenicellales bacterium]